jgi:transposase-like protein
MIHGWVKQAHIDAGERDDKSSGAEKDELARSRAENRTIEEEGEVPNKAAALFAEATNPTTSNR